MGYVNDNQLGNVPVKQVLWGNRYSINWLIYVLVDGIDFRVKEPIFWSSLWSSHNFKAAAVRYEVAVSIGSGNIAHINGPFRVGYWPDITIFRNGLNGMLMKVRG